MADSWEPIENRMVRCAVYTRKSTEHGLDQAVNSLEAQREMCEAYIKCQAHRGWITLPRAYDDGGWSGGTLERPALHRLLSDVEAGRVDVIVIYKIDRLTRSLLDFVRLMDVLGQYRTSFVSVTQCFDTSDSMGRLILNVLLTFAQFERELMSDRVRDKKAAMRKRGLFGGGMPPFGYLIDSTGRLIVHDENAPFVRQIFSMYPDASVREIVHRLQRQGCRTRKWTTKDGRVRGGYPITATTVRTALSNPIYTGHIVHRGEWIEAEIEPLITRECWDQTQAIRQSRQITRDPNRNFLLGILHDDQSRRMHMSRTAPGYGGGDRYYRAKNRRVSRSSEPKTLLVDAGRVEDLTLAVLKAFLLKKSELKRAVLSIGLYSNEIGSLIQKGSLASRRLSLMDHPQLRSALLALIPRAEVRRDGITLYISCTELIRFLGWDGCGIFRKTSDTPPTGERVHEVTADADVCCGKDLCSLPLSACTEANGDPDHRLLAALKEAADLRQFVWENRTRSVAELARAKGMGSSHFAKLLRLNYLAPDIQTAIVDGTQPDGLSRYRLLRAATTLDWDQQRHLLGFS